MTAPAVPQELEVLLSQFGDEGPSIEELELLEGGAPEAQEPPAEELVEEDPELAETRREALIALYGHDFPLLEENAAADEGGDDVAWPRWVSTLFDAAQSGKRVRTHNVVRNRLFYAGQQWVSSRNLAPWREPPKPRDQLRPVYNMIKPALDQRTEIVSEQRPGFQTRPVTRDSDDVRRAEAQQVALEYAYDEHGMRAICRETSYRNGTDGVAFWYVYWDPEAGPWHEVGGRHQPMGDLRTKIFSMEQVVVSPNATATEKPHYVVLKDTVPLSEAVAAYGTQVLGDNLRAGERGSRQTIEGGSFLHQGPAEVEIPGDTPLYTDQETVDWYAAFCEPSEFLPEGLMVVVCGEVTLFQGPLLWGVIPVIRVPDGNPDANYFSVANMELWIPHQMRSNKLLQLWLEAVRAGAGGRVLAKARAISTETLVGGLTSIVEVRSPGPIGDAVQPFPALSVGPDAKELFAIEKKAFEDASGWSDASRGSFQQAPSGRAILATREALERIFSGPVTAMAQAMSEWAKVVLLGMRWGYDIPRAISVTGRGRSDLGRVLSSEDFDGVADVQVDPETLMPMPRALRLFLLDQMLEKGILSPQEYRRRMPFAYTRNLDTPDEDHHARAKRVADALRNRLPAPPVKWQDNEAIHQDVLEREIILRDDLEPDIVMAAEQRWMMLAQQSMMKMGGMPMAPMAQPPGTGSGQPESIDPTQQPLQSASPSIASAPARELTGTTEDSAVVSDFTSPL